jgi:predicted Holliday junction resolvase-like endonuclease
MKRTSSKAAEKRRAVEMISMLEQRGVYVECPHCGSEEPTQLRDCGLFYRDDFVEAALEVYNARVEEHSERLKSLQARMKHIPNSSESGAQAVNAGLIWERLAPCMDSFCFDRNECRSLFDPVDYIVFEGLRKEEVRRVLFLEIKTGTSRLKPPQRQLKALVESKHVSMQVYTTLGDNDAE